MKNNNYNAVEHYMTMVDDLYMRGEYLEGKNLLMEILEIEPVYGRAHSYLGWYYFAQMSDHEKALLHYELALKYDADFAGTHYNYVNLLFSMGRYEEMENAAFKAMTVSGVEKSDMYNEVGRSREMRSLYKKAIDAYKEAFRHCMDNDSMEVIKSNLDRAKMKHRMFEGWTAMFV